MVCPALVGEFSAAVGLAAVLLVHQSSSDVIGQLLAAAERAADTAFWFARGGVTEQR
jgi:hypothetical protein